MKWLLFTGACVAVLVILGALAVDERDVVWEGREASCPYCRVDLPDMAVVCKACNRSVDWMPLSEECTWCLERNDVGHLKDLVEGMKLEEGSMPEGLTGFPFAYFKGIDEGACTFCAGLGQVLEGTAEVRCPVCRGRKRCIACDGDRVVIFADPRARWAARQRLEQRERAERRAKLTGLPLKRTMLVDEDVATLAGFAEIEALRDDKDRSLLVRARERVKTAFALLNEEFARVSAARKAETADDDS